jgi:hypothetical protein
LRVQIDGLRLKLDLQMLAAKDNATNKPRQPMRAQSSSRRTFLLQSAWTALGVLVCAGSGIVTIKYFPPLVTGDTFVRGAVALLAITFAGMFLVRKTVFPPSVPVTARILARAGWALALSFLVLGVFGIGNGLGTPVQSRLVDCVGKRMSRERDPDRRQYVLELRAWPDSSAVTEVDVPRSLYEYMNVPLVEVDTPPQALAALPARARVRLIVGKGRLGVEWIKGVGSS